MTTEQKIDALPQIRPHPYPSCLAYNLSFLAAITALLVLCMDLGFTQELIVFPANGQSQEQMERDTSECHSWATQQTGFDPIQMQPMTGVDPSSSQGPRGERIKGAARGAAIGAVVGEITDDDAGEGATAGAAAGAIAGGMRRRQQRRQETQVQQQKAQQEAAVYAQKRDTFHRAYAACLEGKAYTVK